MKQIYFTIISLLVVLSACTSGNDEEYRNPNTEDSKIEMENASVPSPMK